MAFSPGGCSSTLWCRVGCRAGGAVSAIEGALIGVQGGCGVQGGRLRRLLTTGCSWRRPAARPLRPPAVPRPRHQALQLPQLARGRVLLLGGRLRHGAAPLGVAASCWPDPGVLQPMLRCVRDGRSRGRRRAGCCAARLAAPLPREGGVERMSLLIAIGGCLVALRPAGQRAGAAERAGDA